MAFIRYTPLLFSIISSFLDTTSAATLHPKPRATSQCKVSPSDAAWPSASDWAALNTTVSGRLIKVVPLASVCYAPNYNETECEYVSNNWMSAALHADGNYTGSLVLRKIEI